MSIHEGTAAAPGIRLSPAKQALFEARLRGRGRVGGIVRRDPCARVPLSPAQERLYFLDRLQPGVAAYNIAEAVRLSGTGEAALERALGEVIRRHDTLRTTFHEADGVPFGTVAPFAGFRLPVEDLSSLGGDEREAEAVRRLASENTRGFSLGEGPLLRATLLRLGAGEHVLVLCMHHIVGDGWSTRVLFGELWALYDAFRQGHPSPLPELEVQYADYAAWQREQAGGPAEAAQLRYWRERLAGAPEALDLPADHPRPALPTLRGATVPVAVSPDVLDRLKALARAEGTTVYVAALAAWQACLSHWSGSDDIVVGGVTAGRTRREVEGLIGLFVNTLVLRTGLGGDPTLREVVCRARECLLGAYEHQDLPFERVVAELRPERTLSQSPLFQVMFLLNHVEERASPGAVQARSLDAELGVAKFDLTLELHAHARGLSGTLEYAAELFDRGTALRLAGDVERMLEALAAHPDARLSRLERMGAAERARVVVEWNRTEGDAPVRCIHEIFADRAAAAPSAEAVVYRGRTVTYAELDARANRLAHRLVALGAGPETRVGVCLERSEQWPLALMAALKAGASYVPLDPAYPPERLAYMLADCGATVLVTQESLRPLLPTGIPVVSVDGGADEIAALPATAPATAVRPWNAAYAIYTSGSTGRPKGVQVTHANAANLFAGMDACVGGRVPGTWLAQASISFDMHVVELLWTLARGFRVVILPEMDRAGRGETPAALIRRHAVTHFQCTPSLAAVMVAEDGMDALAGLDRLLLGGEAMPAELAARITRAHPGVLVNMYGPTETTVWSSSFPVAAVDGAVPVGRPLLNQRIYVLDAALRPVPVGVPGELCIGGAGVSRGYVNRPGMTADRFVPDAFGREPGARLYRTGDRARWRADGTLECLGRADGQVKVRGFRIEPGEVEAALRAHGAVRDCVVVAREDRPGEKRLVGYVVPADGGEAGEDALRAHLGARLPRHMVPDALVALAALPLSPNGKLDRRALPAPGARRGARGGGGPADEVEAMLAAIWEELLGVEGIGAGESFFDLGGTSILALRLFSRVNARLGCDLPVSTLFTGATVRHMAHAVREQRRAAGAPASPVVPLQPAGTLPPLWVVHTAGGGVMPYLNVVRHLGPAQPVYGLRDTAADFSRPLAAIAAEYVRAMRQTQPEGPYYLAGWSFGGSVAFEMELQLEAGGQAAAFVGLLDTMSPPMVNDWPSGDADIVAGLAREIAEEHGHAFHVPPEALAGLGRDEQVRLVYDALAARGAAPAGFTAEHLAAACKLNRDRNASRAAYAPGRFGGTLTLFRASGLPDHVLAFLAPRPESDRHDYGWAPYTARPVEVYPVPGSHNTIAAEPHVRALVERLSTALAGARGRAGTPSSQITLNGRTHG